MQSAQIALKLGKLQAFLPHLFFKWPIKRIFNLTVGQCLLLIPIICRSVPKRRVLLSLLTTTSWISCDAQTHETFWQRKGSACHIVFDLASRATLICQLVWVGILTNESIVSLHIGQMLLECIELVLRSNRQKVIESRIFFPTELRMWCKFSQKLLYSQLTIH